MTKSRCLTDIIHYSSNFLIHQKYRETYKVGKLEAKKTPKTRKNYKDISCSWKKENIKGNKKLFINDFEKFCFNMKVLYIISYNQVL